MSLAVLFAIPLFLTVETMMRNSDAYKMTMRAANESPCVTAALGSPLKTGWNITGSIEESSKRGSAEFGIPVKGPRGEGDLEVHAKKLDGSWVIETLVFTHGPTRTNLIPADSNSACQSPS
jgi:hypothetical protein